ncbi:MAG: hypothetical protein ISS47_00265 [Candidatus Omnitrophica bacterium]|nr:hypothetical protein [Candidatus Omnitrophota bacterium]
MYTPLEKVHPVRNKFLTGQADFNPVRRDSLSNGVNRWSLPLKADGGFQPEADPPLAEKPMLAQAVRERSSLTGYTKSN